jgi:hypothetical protein
MNALMATSGYIKKALNLKADASFKLRPTWQKLKPPAIPLNKANMYGPRFLNRKAATIPMPRSLTT